MKRIIAACLTLSLFFTATLSVRAGGALQQIDITNREPSPFPGQILARLVPIRWDARSLPIKYSVNNTLDQIPNPFGAPILSLAQATATLQDSFDAWNDIPTSYIEMRIVNQTDNSGFAGFDMVNELTFRSEDSFGAIAVSPSVSLIQDVELFDGDQLDNDSDPDVSNAISAAADVDNDGDIEFPAGFYKAGTILDNDVTFNTKATNGFRFTVAPIPPDNNSRSVELQTVATHEFGHSHGLSHSLVNQISATDGDSATMFPFIDTGDPGSEVAQRTLAIDDIAFSSFFYQEGTAASGPAALQAGDVPFNSVFGLVKGELRHGELEEPILGGNLFATNTADQTLASSAYSGSARVSFNPATGGLFLAPRALSILNGNYTIPVPLGTYRIGVEAVDGNPVSANSVNLTAIIGSIFGQQNFNEEFYNSSRESDLEVSPGASTPVSVISGNSHNGINLITNQTIDINNFGSLDSIGFSAPPGTYYAVQIPAEQIAAANPNGDILIQAAQYHTFPFDSSTVPVFAEALLTTGIIGENGTAQVDLDEPLARATGFIGQDNDLTPFYFDDSRALGRRVRAGINSGEIENLFLLLRVPEAPFPGFNGVPPLIGLDVGNDAPIFGLSFVSTNDGATFNRRTDLNFRFGLVLSEAPVAPVTAPRPVLECVVANTNGTYTANFGYLNGNSFPVTVPIGENNKFSPSPADRRQPTVFQPGRVRNAFSVTFNGNNLVWTLGLGNSRRSTATASRNSARCR